MDLDTNLKAEAKQAFRSCICIYIYIYIYINSPGTSVVKVTTQRPFTVFALARARASRPLKARFSFPNGSPNRSKIASGRFLEATGSENLILRRSKQDFHRFSVHTKVWNVLKTGRFLKILLVRHFRLSSLTKSSQALQKRLKIDVKTVPNRFRIALGSMCFLELDFWSHLSLI